MAEPPSPTLRSLTGVYHARGSLTGEVAYWVGARLGRAHCALCDITHGTFREKRTWATCRAGLPVPFRTVHLDEREPPLAAATEGRTPCVVAHTDVDGPEGIALLLGPAELEACGGQPEALVAAIEAAVERRGLAWPPAG